MNEDLTEIERIKKEYARRSEGIPKQKCSLSNSGNRMMVESRNRSVASVLKKEGVLSLTAKSILEVGCGKGGWFDFLKIIGAQEPRLAGIDLMEDRAQSARQRFPSADIRIGDASKLPWADESFDLVIQSTVFTSVLDYSLKQKIADEMLRVLKRGGMIFWYDFFFDNPWNANVKGVGKKEINSLFNGCVIRLEKVTLAPPIVRFLAPVSEPLCSAIEKLKLLNTHYLGVIKKR